MSASFGSSGTNFLSFDIGSDIQTYPRAYMCWVKRSSIANITEVNAYLAMRNNARATNSCHWLFRDSGNSRYYGLGEYANYIYPGVGGEEVSDTWVIYLLVSNAENDHRFYYGPSGTKLTSSYSITTAGGTLGFRYVHVGSDANSGSSPTRLSRDVIIARAAIWYGFSSNAFGDSEAASLVSGTLPSSILPGSLYAYWPLNYTGSGVNLVDTVASRTFTSNGTVGESTDEPPTAATGARNLLLLGGSSGDLSVIDLTAKLDGVLQ